MQTANVNVPIKVTGRHVSVTEAIKDYAVSRIEHLHLALRELAGIEGHAYTKQFPLPVVEIERLQGLWG